MSDIALGSLLGVAFSCFYFSIARDYWLFKRHDIFTFFNNNRDVGVLFSPALVIKPEEVSLFFDAMDATLDHGLLKVMADFFKSKIVKKISG